MADEKDNGTAPAKAEQPASGVDAGSTPSSGDASPKGKTFSQEQLDSIIKSRLERERKTWDEEKTKAAERAKLEESERLKLEVDDRDKIIETMTEEIDRLNFAVSLSGKVVDVEAAARLATDDIRKSEDPPSSLLEKYPFLAPQGGEPSRKSPTSPANPGAAPKDGNLNPSDFRGKPKDWVLQNLDRLRRS